MRVLVIGSGGREHALAWALNKSPMLTRLFVAPGNAGTAEVAENVALDITDQSLKDNRRPFVVEIDFANFFNTIPHRLLMKFLGKRISDNRFKGLIGRFIQNNTLDSSGNMFTPDIGTPQGSSMSPVLANVYLHEVVDAWFIQTFASYTSVMVRYADDAVFFFNKEISALTLIESLNKRVSNYGLTLNQDKTKVISFDKNGSNDFDFLGSTFYWGRKWASTKRILKSNASSLYR